MKKYIFTITLLSFLTFQFIQAGVPRAIFNYAAFYSPATGPYVETYLNVAGRSVQYLKKDNGKFQAGLLVTMLFKQNDTIKSALKYQLQSPEIEDTTNANHAFFDLQRVMLPNGTYELELSIADASQPDNAVSVTQKLNILFDDTFAISGIETVEKYSKTESPNSLSKSGYDIMPYLDNFYPENINKIAYYTEIYNADKLLGNGEKFIVTSSIKSLETKNVIGDLMKQKIGQAKDVNVILNEFNIEKLPSGNYMLEVSVRDKENKEMLSSSMFFQRSNPGMTFDVVDLSKIEFAGTFVDKMSLEDLRENIRSLEPIATVYEDGFIVRQVETADENTLKAFLLRFWTDRKPADPESSWNTYYDAVQHVNEKFGCTRTKGYQTDRGRVFLKYGAPNSRQEELVNDITYPYEIWQYYMIGTQSNCRFVFMTRDATFECFQIIHSNVIGEVNNPVWQRLIYRDFDGFVNDPSKLIHQAVEDIGTFDSRSGQRYNRPY